MRRQLTLLLIVLIAGGVYVGAIDRGGPETQPVRPDPEEVPDLPVAPEMIAAEEDLVPIEVLVLDNYERPLLGCRVRVTALDDGPPRSHPREFRAGAPDPAAEGLTDEEGRATFRIAREGGCRVTATLPGSHATAADLMHAPGRVVLRLARGVVFRGRALINGSPAVGSRVLFRDWNDADSAYEVVDRTGWFALTVVPTRGTLDILHAGRTYSFPQVPPYEAEPVFELGAGSEIEGVVRNESGRPVAGAQVIIESEDVFVRTVSGRNGEFRVSGLPAGRPGITVCAEGYAPCYPDPDAPPAWLAAGQKRLVEVVLGEGTRVHGRVVDAETGGPLPGTEITASRSFYESVPPRITTIADDRGRFEFRAAPGHPLDIMVRDREHRLAPGKRGWIVPEGTLDLGDLEVRGSIAFEGRILDVDGVPRIGVDAVYRDDFSRSLVRVRTDDEGRFRIHTLAPEGGLYFNFFDPVWGRVRIWWSDFPKAPADLQPPRPASLEGVVALNGQSVAGAAVEADHRSQRGYLVARNCRALTDERGRYRLPRLSRGPYRLTVIHPDAERFETDLEPLRPGEATVLDVELTPGQPRSPENEASGLSIGGQVRSDEELPLPGIGIRLSGVRTGYQSTDVEGRFFWPDVPAGSYRLRFNPPHDSPWAENSLKVEAGGEEVVLVLGRACALEARVRLPSGEPCLRGSARLSRSGIGTVWTGSVEDGNIHFCGLVDGEYILILDVHGHLPLEIAVSVPCAPLILQLDAGAAIEGRVIDLVGDPVEGARVTAAMREQGLYERTVTDRDGWFSIRGLGPGTYDLTAVAKDKEGREYTAGPVRVSAGAGPVTLELELAKD